MIGNPLIWTSETPREAGLYLHRLGPGCETRIAHVSDLDGWWVRFDVLNAGWAREIRGQWAGPIPPPKEP